MPTNRLYPVTVHTQGHKGFIRAEDGATAGATIGVDLIFDNDGVAGVKELGLSTGVLSGGKITINPMDNTKIDIAPGAGIWIDFEQTPPQVLTQTWPKIEGVTITNIAIQPVTYISLDRDLNVIQTSAELLNMERRKWVELGIAVHTNNTNVNVINTLAAIVESGASQLHDFMEAVGPFNKSGNVYTAVGGNLQLRKTGGDIFKFGVAYDSTLFDPHTIDQLPVNPITFRYRKRDSVEYADTLVIDPNNYDLNNVLTVVQANRYTVQRIYMFQSGLTRIQYGQAEYQTLNEAIGTFEKEVFTTELNMRTNGIPRAFLVIKQGATDLADPAQAQFFEVSKFGTATGAGGGGIDAATIITALGYTPANQAVQIIAGAGLTGGGDLSTNRTLNIGTPSSVTSTSTNSTTADSHTHALVITGGAGSGLDADLLRGSPPDVTNVANTIAKRDSSGDLICRLSRTEYEFTNSNVVYFVTQVALGAGANNYHRPSTVAQAAAALDSILAPLASPSFTGTVSMGGTVTMTGAGSEFNRANANSTTLTRQPRTFVQAGDPGAAAADGDLWLWMVIPLCIGLAGVFT